VVSCYREPVKIIFKGDSCWWKTGAKHNEIGLGAAN